MNPLWSSSEKVLVVSPFFFGEDVVPQFARVVFVDHYDEFWHFHCPPVFTSFFCHGVF